jgi:effector-binding domain-containing protein
MAPKRIVAWPVLGLAAAGLWTLAFPALGQGNPPDNPPAVVTRDAFGEEVTFPPRTVLFRKGEATWEDGWAKLNETFKELRAAADRLGLKVTGPPLVIYRGTDDDGFKYEAALPIETAPREAPGGGLATGPGPIGKAIKFVHRGSFDTLDTSYELITNFLDSKRIEAEELSVEEFVSDPVTTQPDDLVINIYMVLKKQ